MRRWLGLIYVALLGLSGCVSAGAGAGLGTDETVALTNVRVIDPARAEVSEPSTILVRFDRILAVMPASGTLPASMRKVDGEGAFAIPGLWDMHVHSLSDPERAIERILPLFVAHGVTGVRDMGSTLAGTTETRARLAADRALVAPRLYVSGPILDGRQKPYLGQPGLQIVLESAADADARLPLLQAAGVDFLKIYDDLGVEALAAIKAEADAWRMPLAGHAPAELGVAGAVRLGLRSIEHLNMWIFADCVPDSRKWLARAISEKFGRGWTAYYEVMAGFEAALDQQRCDAVYAAMAQHGTWFTPTLVTELNDRSRIDEAKLPLVAEAGRAWCEKNLRDIDESDEAARSAAYRFLLGQFARMRAAGVRILAGSDMPNYCLVPGAGLHWELDRLVEAGMSPAEALQAATGSAAQAMGRGHQVGRIAPGYDADLVLLGSNPLKSLSALRQIKAVVSRGRLLARPELDAIIESASAPSASTVAGSQEASESTRARAR